MRIVAVALALAALAGCADPNERWLTIATTPSAATIVNKQTGGRYLSPVRLGYALPESNRSSDGCFYVASMEAHWASGAVAAVTNRLCGSGNEWNTTVSRPNVPGLQTDLMAEQNQRLANLQAQVEASQPSPLGEALNEFADDYAASKARQPRLVLPPPVSCTSQVIGNNVYSNCH